MFKALNLQARSEIIILAPQWREQRELLCRLDRADLLVCPACEQPVRLKAGRRVRWHFAHKHLGNCALQYASPELLAARAALYPWLVARFGEGRVSLEVILDDLQLPRPVDGFVRLEERQLVYWIIDARLKPGARQGLRTAFEGGKQAVHWVFTDTMLRPVEEDLTCVYLTTTERDFCQSSEYDLIGARDLSRPGASLHYLDAAGEMLHTYRGLRLVHPPQMFCGRPLSAPLAQVSADPQSGAFVHPGEADALEEVRRDQAARRALHAQARRVFRQGRADASPRRPPLRSGEALLPQSSDQAAGEDGKGAAPLPVGPPPAHQLGNIDAVCVFCGQITSDWWYLDRKTGRCKCRECLSKGVA